MKKNKNLLIGIISSAVIISASLVFLGFQIGQNGKNSVVTAEDIENGIKAYVAKDQPSENNKAQPTPTLSGDFSDDDPFMGDEEASVTIVEFSDFQCPYCRKFYNEALPQIKEKYIETGKIKFVYRDFPLNFHSGAFPSALASECARDQGGDEIYFAMHDKIFDGQNALGSGTVEISDESLISYAEELDLDMDEFNECFEEERYKEEIYQDLSVGQSAGITGTPGFILDGQIISGAQPFSVFESAIEKALNK